MNNKNENSVRQTLYMSRQALYLNLFNFTVSMQYTQTTDYLDW